MGVNGLKLDDVAEDSRVVASRLHMPNEDVHPLVTPIYHSSTYKIKSVDQYLQILKDVRVEYILVLSLFVTFIDGRKFNLVVFQVRKLAWQKVQLEFLSVEF